MNEIHSGRIKDLRDQPQNTLRNMPVKTPQVHPAPNSSILIEPNAPACKRVISRAFSAHEVISLIEAIFTNKEEVRMIRGLSGDAAQTFIDVVHEVRLYIPSFPGHCGNLYPLRFLELSSSTC